MSSAWRQQQILMILYRRHHETVENLAYELGVSVRTITRDINELSSHEPIYTQTGRYGGGVYIMKDYTPSFLYFSDVEMQVLKTVESILENSCDDCKCSKLLKDYRNLISSHTKPKYKKGKQK